MTELKKVGSPEFFRRSKSGELTLKLRNEQTIYFLLPREGNSQIHVSCIEQRTNNGRYTRLLFSCPENIRVVEETVTGSSNCNAEELALQQAHWLFYGHAHGAQVTGFAVYTVFQICEGVSQDHPASLTNLSIVSHGTMEKGNYYPELQGSNLAALFQQRDCYQWGAGFRFTNWKNSDFKMHLYRVQAISEDGVCYSVNQGHFASETILSEQYLDECASKGVHIVPCFNEEASYFEGGPIETKRQLVL